MPNFRKCAVLKGVRITLAGKIPTYNELKVYLSEILSTIVPPSFSTFIIRLSGLKAGLECIQSTEIALDDLIKRGTNTGMVFRVKVIDPSTHLPPTGTQRSLRLEPCHWNAVPDSILSQKCSWRH